MAGPTKKPKKPATAESDDESMSEESESGTYHGQQEIQATFEGRNPEVQDFHGIKQLLNQLFLKAHVNISEFSDMLIQQNGIGSVLKQGFNDSDEEDDDDEVDDASEKYNVFGITSVVNLTAHKEAQCVQQFFSLLKEFYMQHTDPSTQNSVKNILCLSNKLGFIVNERFVNIPSKISSVMFSSLYDEIERRKKKDPSYNFEYFIMICKTCRPKEDKDSEEIFSNDEEEIFAKEAEISFDFSVADESDTGLGGKWLSEDKQVLPYRRILIFKADKFKNIIDQVTAFVQ